MQCNTHQLLFYLLDREGRPKSRVSAAVLLRLRGGRHDGAGDAGGGQEDGGGRVQRGRRPRDVQLLPDRDGALPAG